MPANISLQLVLFVTTCQRGKLLLRRPTYESLHAQNCFLDIVALKLLLRVRSNQALHEKHTLPVKTPVQELVAHVVEHLLMEGGAVAGVFWGWVDAGEEPTLEKLLSRDFLGED